MFDLEAFEADFAAWDAASRSGLDVHAASAGAIDLAERAEDAIAEIRRLRAVVARAQSEAAHWHRVADDARRGHAEAAEGSAQRERALRAQLDHVVSVKTSAAIAGQPPVVVVLRDESRAVFGIYDTTREPPEAP